MRVTRLGPTKPILSLTGILSTSDVGPAGQVPVSNGSNSVAWGSNISDIFVNATTHVRGPFVNFADGSNTTITVDTVNGVASNTIRWHSTGGGGSFGSNSTDVSETTQVGASSNTARADHYHRGIERITASSSNTMQRGTVNLRPGSGIALSLTDTDGDGEFDTATIVNTGAGGGGSGAPTSAKYVTLAADSGLSAEKVRADLYNYSADNTPTTATAVADEFDDGSLDGAWSWDSTPGTVTESDYPGYLWVSGDTTERHLNRSWSPGATDLTIAAKLYWTEPTAGEASEGLGIYVGNSTGNPTDSVLVQIINAGVFAGYDETASVFTQRFAAGPGGMGDLARIPFYLRLTREVSGPTWRFYFSWDGMVWYPGNGTSTKSLTVGAVGIRADTAGQWAVDWIRGWTSIVTKVGS